MGVSGQRNVSVALYRRGKDPRYPLDGRLGGPQSRQCIIDAFLTSYVTQYGVG